ncbi:right-handed parallel beta-helix repeat-containing protein [Neobacillus niacini]|uniref:right-handed parallel beta-helix repeat-containing protein n=1 Tax=Neobacillus niacini TaxID=86668 RepID=UPI002041FBC1|nr:right-handed parallel beta-helix repeat-containing protein [Neobacillus niacini]
MQVFIGIIAFLFGFSIKQKGEDIILQRDNNKIKDMVGFSPEDYRKDDEKDYTKAFSRIISEIKRNGHGSIILSQNREYVGNIIITASNINVSGKGILKGSIKIEGEKIEPYTKRYSGTRNITINEITIEGEGKRNGISIQFAYGITIDGVYFKNCLRSITVNSIDYRQHVSRLDIINNHFLNCQYGYFVNKGSSKTYVCGDVKFNNNTDESTPNAKVERIATIAANGQDGIIINGNVLFGGSGTIKNIYIDNSNWVTVGANNLFAPKEHCIHVQNSKNVTISGGNNCAWAKKDAILLDNCSVFTIVGNTISWYEVNGLAEDGYSGSGIVIKNSQQGYGNISTNTIIFPYRNGIRLEQSGQITVGMNTIRNYESKEAAISASGEYNHIVGNSCIGFLKGNHVDGKNSIDNLTFTI